MKSLIIFMTFVIFHSLALPPPLPLPPVPPFLKDAPRSVIKSFHSLIGNAHDLTDKEIDRAIEGWVEKQSDEIQAKWLEFQEEHFQRQQASAAAHKAAYEKFSPLAKKADRELAQVVTHTDLTARQKYEKIAKILESLPKNVRHEIESALFTTE